MAHNSCWGPGFQLQWIDDELSMNSYRSWWKEPAFETDIMNEKRQIQALSLYTSGIDRLLCTAVMKSTQALVRAITSIVQPEIEKHSYSTSNNTQWKPQENGHIETQAFTSHSTPECRQTKTNWTNYIKPFQRELLSDWVSYNLTHSPKFFVNVTLSYGYRMGPIEKGFLGNRIGKGETTHTHKDSFVLIWIRLCVGFWIKIPLLDLSV